jgi:hypothetical protein
LDADTHPKYTPITDEMTTMTLNIVYYCSGSGSETIGLTKRLLKNDILCTVVDPTFSPEL